MGQTPGARATNRLAWPVRCVALVGATVLLGCLDFDERHYRFPCEDAGCTGAGGGAAAGGSAGGASQGGIAGGTTGGSAGGVVGGSAGGLGGGAGGGSAGGVVGGSVGGLGGGAGGGWAGGGVGGSTGGTGGGVGGGSAGGVGPSYVYSLLELDVPEGSGPIVSISGPVTNMYAAGNYGALFRSTDGIRFTRLPRLGPITLSAVYVAPDGKVFLASGANLAVCASPPCLTSTSFVWTTPPGTIGGTAFMALCGDSSSNVYAVGARPPFSDAGVVVRFDGTRWSSEFNLGIEYANSCWLESSTVLWAAGRYRVARWSNGASTPMGDNLDVLGSEARQQQWLAVFGLGGTVHVAGEKERIMTRSPAGVWSLSRFDTARTSFTLRAIGGLSPDEVFAVGHACSSCPEPILLLRWNGAEWFQTPAPRLDVRYLRSAVAVGPQTMYFGGELSDNTSRGAIIRAERQVR